jgi:hypothetical protein
VIALGELYRRNLGHTKNVMERINDHPSESMLIFSINSPFHTPFTQINKPVQKGSLVVTVAHP